MYLHTHTYSGMNFRTKDVVYYIIAWHYLERSNTQKSNKWANREKITLLNVRVGARTIIATYRSSIQSKFVDVSLFTTHSHRHIFQASQLARMIFWGAFRLAKYGAQATLVRKYVQKCFRGLPLIHWQNFPHWVRFIDSFSQAKNVVRRMQHHCLKLRDSH